MKLHVKIHFIDRTGKAYEPGEEIEMDETHSDLKDLLHRGILSERPDRRNTNVRRRRATS